jgi:hypothetical protein
MVCGLRTVVAAAVSELGLMVGEGHGWACWAKSPTRLTNAVKNKRQLSWAAKELWAQNERKEWNTF